MNNHDDSNNIPPHLRASKEDIIAALEQLIDKFERGQVPSAALRVYSNDGNYEDVVLGGESEEERAAMLAKLQQQVRSGLH